MHLFHTWSPWETIRSECIEQQGGVLVPYYIQQRHCKKCNVIRIKVSDIKYERPL